MMMAEYRFFKLNASGMIDTAAVLRLADDFSALSHARDLHEPQPVEIWRGRHQVGITAAAIERRGAARDAMRPDTKTPGGDPGRSL
jgi:hypothetical protein